MFELRVATLTLCLLAPCSLSAFAADEAAEESPVDRTAELLLISDDFGLADGPAWDGRSALFVPDVKRSRLMRFLPAKQEITTFRDETSRISAAFFAHGRLYLSDNGNAAISTVVAGSPQAQIEELVRIDTSENPKKRPNDLVVDRFGGVYFTLTGQNEVVYLPQGGDLRVVTTDVPSPNGLVLSPDERTLYVAAYKPKQVYALAVAEDGSLGNSRLFAAMDDGEALGADGMTVDRAGNVYCAGATAVWIWSPDGKLLDKIACPTRPINCAFGDPQMRTLFITGFGGLYAQPMRISGKAPHPPSDDLGTTAENSNRPSTEIPDSIIADMDVVYANYGNRRLLADIFRPGNTDKPRPAVIVVHGGGWLHGDKVKFRGLAIALAKKGFVTAAIEYRLGDEALFPAGIHDCNAAVRFLRANAQLYGINAQKIAAVGGSAGGHLVGLMASGWKEKSLQGDGGHADKSSRLQAAVVMAGPMQVASGSVAERSRTAPDSNANVWIGNTIDAAEAVYHLADAYEKIDADTAPILFMTGEHDNPERNEPSREKLRGAGVFTDLKIYTDGRHGCWNQNPWFDLMVDDMADFLRSQLSR